MKVVQKERIRVQDLVMITLRVSWNESWFLFLVYQHFNFLKENNKASEIRDIELVILLKYKDCDICVNEFKLYACVDDAFTQIVQPLQMNVRLLFILTAEARVGYLV